MWTQVTVVTTGTELGGGIKLAILDRNAVSI